MKATDANSMPWVDGALSGWTSTVCFMRIKQYVVDGLVKENKYPITFRGVVQPLEPKALYLKPEGQRAFTWLQVHVAGGHLDLKVNDKVEYRDKRFKIMAKLNYSQNDYEELHMIEDRDE